MHSGERGQDAQKSVFDLPSILASMSFVFVVGFRRAMMREYVLLEVAREVDRSSGTLSHHVGI